MTMKKTATKPVKKTLPKSVTKTGKVFILDTSVILHDPGCIYNFEQHDVVIPIHVVDKLRYLKKDLNYNQAIEFCRTLDSLAEDHVFNGGIKIGDSLGILEVSHSVPIMKAIRNDFTDQDSVVKTISLALSLQKQKPDKHVVIVSKDPAVRVLAKAFSILAEDYKFDRVSDISFLSEDVKELQMGSDFINSLYKERTIKTDLKDLRENQNLVLNAVNQPALVQYRDGHFKIIQTDKIDFADVRPINLEQKFLYDALLDPDIFLVTVEGLAGSGKTLVPVAYALQQLKDKKCKKIFYTRKTIETGDHSMGFLPGTMEEKMSEYTHGLNDSLDFISSLNTANEVFIRNAKINKELKIEAINYIRGRTIPNAIFIVDEAQNITPHDAKTLISRAGKNTKFILLGDNSQIDVAYLDKFSNGFTHTIKSFIGTKRHAHIRLKECERSELAKLAAERM